MALPSQLPMLSCCSAEPFSRTEGGVPASDSRSLVRMLQGLSRANHILVRAASEEALLAQSCANLVEAGGYPLVFVEYADDAAGGHMRVVASAGDDYGNFNWGGGADPGLDATGMAIGSGQALIVRDFAGDPKHLPWCDEVTRRGYVASATLPLREGARLLGALRIFSRDKAAFAEAEVGVLGELADTMAFGVGNLRTVSACQQAEARLNLFEEHLSHLSTHDSLTGLANRTLLTDRLAQTLSHQERGDRQAAVVMVDIDRFKNINGNLGHTAANRLLFEMAYRLRSCVRDGDTVARIGVDEFAIVLADVAHADDVAVVTEKMVASIGRPLQTGAQEIFPTASVGVSLFPQDGRSAETLLHNAEAAMLRAKEHGGNTVRFYDCEMARRAQRRLDLESRLRRAIDRDEFVLHYQPKVCLLTGEITGAEALLRWLSPDEGLVSPGEFIPVAEECGLILPIGRRVLDLALGQLRQWTEAGESPVPIAVNLSTRQFRDESLARSVAEALDRAQVPAGMLELEITESMVMDDPEGAMATLRQLRDMGILLALDDFGTGYSSLAYLKRFPINFLKIDRSFVRDLHHDQDDAAIVQAILAMARSLRLKVIAEGVETSEQVDRLMRHRCDAMQGFYFSQPLPAGEFMAFARDYRLPES